MNNCLVCGKSNEVSQFGSYCSKDCRDSDIAVLGRTFCCEECGSDFKSITKKSLCVNCVKEAALTCDGGSYKPISAFRYSIFEDNVQRIVIAANRNDKRNCVHAVKVISDTCDPSILPILKDYLSNSNEKAQVWLQEIAERLKEKEVLNS